MSYNFDLEIDRSGTQSVKWNFIKEHTGVEDALPLWVADMDFPVADEISEAIIKRASHPLYGYTTRPDSYYQAIIGWYSRRQDWVIEKKWITHSTGVINAIYTAVYALSETGDGVIIQTPVYHPFPKLILNTGRRIVENPLLYSNGRYSINFEDLKQKIKNEKVKILLLCNPHNPVGRVYTAGELKAIGEICLENGVRVISDEVHGDLVFLGFRHIPFVVASPESLHTSVICTAPSKTFNLAGLSTSNIIIPDDELRLRFDQANEKVGMKTFNLFGSVACEAAYTHGEKWLEEVLTYINANRIFATDFLREALPCIRIVDPEGTYFLWVNLSQLGLSPVKLEKFLLQGARLWFNQGFTFGTGGDGFVRINLACRRALLEEACGRLVRAINGNVHTFLG